MRTNDLFIVATLLVLMHASGLALAADESFGDDAKSFRADIYPSAHSALAALSLDVAASLRKVQPQQIILTGDAGADVMQVLKEEFPQAQISTEKPTDSKPAAGHAWVHVKLKEAQQVGAVWGGSDLISGTLAATMTTAEKPVQLSAKFVKKAWADDWSSFVNRDPNRKWILAQSPRPCINEREAEEECRKDAALALWPAVREQMQINARGRPTIKVSQEFVVTQIEATLSRGVGVADKFVQRFDRPYGKIWKQMMLIDASKPTIDAMAQEMTRVVHQRSAAQRSERTRLWGSTLALGAVMTLLYFFVNAITKGYFAWRLRAAALLLAIVGILIVLSVT